MVLKRILFYSFVILITASCKKKEKTIVEEKEVVVYQDPVYKWSRVSFFDEALSSYIKEAVNLSGNRLLFYSTNYVIIYDSLSNEFKTINWNSITEQQNRPLITNNYCIRVSSAKDIGIIPTGITTGPSQIANSLDMLSLDSSFFSYNFLPKNRTGELIGNDNTLIIPYHTKEANTGSNFLCIKLKTFSLNAGASIAYTYDTYKKIHASEEAHTLSRIGNNFLVSINDRNYIITAGFDTVALSKDLNFYSTFKYKNQQYAYVFTAQGGKIVSTPDDGLTWYIKYDVGSNFNYFNYSVVGDHLIAYTASSWTNANRLYEITITPTYILINELENDGLKNVTINSVNLLNNRVFISTDNGVYERPYSEFIEYK